VLRLLTLILEAIAEVHDWLTPSRADIRREVHDAVVKASETGDTADLEKSIERRVGG
jgi:hypothetical protein